MEAQAIVLVADIARRTGLDFAFVKGVVVGRGHPLTIVGTAFVTTEKAAADVERFLSQTPVPEGWQYRGRRRKPEPAARKP